MDDATPNEKQGEGGAENRFYAITNRPQQGDHI